MYILDPFHTKQGDLHILSIITDYMRIRNVQEQAMTRLVELMKLYQPDTLFFINAWAWGYEDILKSISRAFLALVWSFTSLMRSSADLVQGTCWPIHIFRLSVLVRSVFTVNSDEGCCCDTLPCL